MIRFVTNTSGRMTLVTGRKNSIGSSDPKLYYSNPFWLYKQNANYWCTGFPVDIKVVLYAKHVLVYLEWQKIAGKLYSGKPQDSDWMQFLDWLWLNSIISSLLNHFGKGCYKVTVIHSLQAVMSACLLTDEKGKLQAAAHLIGTNQLPLPAHVSV